ncbi:DUF2177 family protein [Roseicyclus sp.]
MSLLVLFLATSVIFLVADAVMLRSVIQPVFARHLGATLYEGGFRLLPAVLFYLTYMGGVLYFASWPALRDGAPGLAAVNGAILGLVAYGTYEFTSWAVMRDWHVRMVAVDLPWGVAVTALSAWGGVVVTRAILG